MTTPEMLKFLILWTAQAVGLPELRRWLLRIGDLTVVGPRHGAWPSVAPRLVRWSSASLFVNVAGVATLNCLRRRYVDLAGQPIAAWAGVNSFWPAFGLQDGLPATGTDGGGAAGDKCPFTLLT
jgi:hypothetical protein